MFRKRNIALGSLIALSALAGDQAATFATIDVPGAAATYAIAINPGGVVTGYYDGLNFTVGGFLRAADGTLTTFSVPVGTTEPTSINPSGVIAGNWDDANGVVHGFLRAADGTITEFDVF